MHLLRHILYQQWLDHLANGWIYIYIHTSCNPSTNSNPCNYSTFFTTSFATFTSNKSAGKNTRNRDWTRTWQTGRIYESIQPQIPTHATIAPSLPDPFTAARAAAAGRPGKRVVYMNQSNHKFQPRQLAPSLPHPLPAASASSRWAR